MIAQLRGKLIEKNLTDLIIDCNGIGYQVHISLNTYGKIPDGESIMVYTHLQVKEDSHTLYGFVDKGERAVFKLLISVSGIGANTARTMLSSLTPDQIAQGIAVGDVPLIQSVKGIGAKTAQRVIIELKDKIMKAYAIDEVSAIGGNTARDEALSALETLGFNKKMAEKALDKILGSNVNATTELLIKEALKML